MKTIVTTLAVAAISLFVTAPEAEARHSSRIYISGHMSCGTPIYKERYFVGYDRWGREIWQTRVVRHHYRPVVRPRYVAPLPPPRHYHRGYDRRHRGNHVSFHATFGR